MYPGLISIHQPNPTETTLQQLWLHFREGDKWAFGELARLHYKSLYNYGLRLTPDPELVWDTIQDLFLELWDNRETGSEVIFVKTYLLKALRNKLLKSIARQATSIDISQAELAQRLSVTSAEDQMVAHEQATEQERMLHQLLRTLTKRQQEILYLRFYQNLAYEEIARVMGLERQSVANLLHRAIKEIRSQWVSYLAIVALLFAR